MGMTDPYFSEEPTATLNGRGTQDQFNKNVSWGSSRENMNREYYCHAEIDVVNHEEQGKVVILSVETASSTTTTTTTTTTSVVTETQLEFLSRDTETLIQLLSSSRHSLFRRNGWRKMVNQDTSSEELKIVLDQYKFPLKFDSTTTTMEEEQSLYGQHSTMVSPDAESDVDVDSLLEQEQEQDSNTNLWESEYDSPLYTNRVVEEDYSAEMYYKALGMS